MKLHFSAEILITGVNPYVFVSAERVKELRAGWRKPMPVRVQINGQPEPPWHINMMPQGDGSFFLYLSGVVRKASGTGVGDTVEVDLEFDEEYCGGPEQMPEWFVEALEKNTSAAAGWVALTPSRQKEVARYLAALKSAEARERNLLTAIQLLGGVDGHWMGRDWRGGK